MHLERSKMLAESRGRHMFKVLVFGMTENPGGVESVILNYYRNIDRSKIQFDFLCNSHEKVAFEDELVKMGGKCIHFPARSKDYFGYKKELNRFFREHAHEYGAIWVNVCSLANIDYLILAKKYGIRKRIIHSHNSQNMDSRLRGMLHKFNKRRIGKIATDFYSCSKEASDWFYTKDIMPKVVLINNAISTERMRFDEEKRQKIRNEYGLSEDYVIGNVGRLHFQKNQTFMLDIFEKTVAANKNVKLVLIGQGEDEEMLKKKASELGISDKVIFAGVQYDIAGWLSAFDLFLFPSLFEGLSIAALEAQANGIPVLASDGVIPPEVRMNDNFVFFSLDAGAGKWNEKLLDMKENVGRVDFETVKKNFVKKGFDIENEAKIFERNMLKG